MKTTQTSCSIAAPAEAVWRVLTDKQILSNGAFGIGKIEGNIRPLETIEIWPDSGTDRTFTLKIATFDPCTLMVWKSGMRLGLFKGVRQFRLTPTASGTDFHMREDFTGLMVGLVTKSLPDLQPSFDKFAMALKHHAEGVNA